MIAPRFTLLALAFASGCRAAGTPVPVPVSPQPRTYLLRLGSDTLAVDQFTVAGDRVEGTLVTHLPRAVVTRYAATLNPATGMVIRIAYHSRLPDGSLLQAGAQPSVREVSIAFAGDSAVARIQRDTVTEVRAAARNAFPYINYSMAFFQLPITALRAANRDSAAYAIYTGGRVTTPMGVTRTGPTSYSVAIGGFPYRVATDADGVVETVDGARTTQHFVATRQGPVDLSGLAAEWGRRDRAAAPVTVLSPRDTTRAAIGAAQLWVDYSRPLARGRRVWGANGVLNDSIWRTGANAATQFRTNVPITVGGQAIPAGTYTLWTLAIPGRYHLIINKQTGQWGTQYDRGQDLARIPARAARLPEVVDRFTIAIDPSGTAGGTLRLRWDTTELSVPFTIP